MRITLSDNHTSIAMYADRIEIRIDANPIIWQINETQRRMEQLFNQCLLAYPCQLIGLNYTITAINATMHYIVHESRLCAIFNDIFELQSISLYNRSITPEDIILLEHMDSNFNFDYIRRHHVTIGNRI